MNDPQKYIWHTGDWKEPGSDKPPYNGVKIEANATYSKATSPPTAQVFRSVDLKVTDYTRDKNGVSSVVTLDQTGRWYDIKIPKNEHVSPPLPNRLFTVCGIHLNTLGRIRLDVLSAGIYVNIEFRFGMGDRKREEIGYIMKIDKVKKADNGDHIIHVEQ